MTARALNGSPDKAVDVGDTEALPYLAILWQEAGDRDGVERLRRFGLTAAGDVEEPWT
ncbi:hypothetical protein [Actinomadura decatromicini]|uniref:hypothetical protein n=1 Tax=Actinomadura decatromicini TaxID=2604572 RepID=UPI001652C937|nr:hypothetical protein [Actinomadura decatromicini]